MRETIIRTIEQLREYITIDISSDLNVVMPYILQSEKYVRDIIGDELFDLLIAETTNPTDERLTNLLPYCRMPLANLAYFHAIDKLNVNVGNAGITVASTSSLVPASKERIDKLRESVNETGMFGLEELIKFLEKKKEDYPEWESSDAYSFQKLFFINNARDFKNAIQKNIGRIEFLQLREYILLAQITIEEAICEELYDELMNQNKEGNISVDNEKLMKIIRPAVCYFSLGKRDDSKLWVEEGEKKIKQLRDFLNENASEELYPLYYSSPCYSATLTKEYNDEDNGLYSFGI